MDKFKANNTLEILFCLLEAGEAGVGEKELLSRYQCNPRTLERYWKLFASQSQYIRFEVETADQDRRWRAHLLGVKTSGSKTQPRTSDAAQLLKAVKSLYMPFPDQGEETRAVAVQPDAEAPINEKLLVKFLDHLIQSTDMGFLYKAHEISGIPLVLASSRDGLYFVCLVYPQKSLYNFRIDRIRKIDRPDLEKRAQAGELPDLDALRMKVVKKLRVSQNMFISWKDDNETFITFRFRGLEKRMLQRICRGAQSFHQPDAADPLVQDVKVMFSGWLEASKFMKEFLGTYSIVEPEWAAAQFKQEIEAILDEL